KITFRMGRPPLHIVLPIAAFWATSVLGMAGERSKLNFEADIRPILKAHCFDCHGEGEKLNGSVDLRLRHFLVEMKTDDGMVVVPGEPDKSVLVKVIEAGDMPKKGKKLATNEVALIR